jgi:hypothetical protein
VSGPLRLLDWDQLPTAGRRCVEESSKAVGPDPTSLSGKMRRTGSATARPRPRSRRRRRAVFGPAQAVTGVISSVLVLLGLPLGGLGLYGTAKGAGRAPDALGLLAWLRPPVAHLTVALVLFVAAGPASGQLAIARICNARRSSPLRRIVGRRDAASAPRAPARNGPAVTGSPPQIRRSTDNR